jgi:hypothetical protein
VQRNLWRNRPCCSFHFTIEWDFEGKLGRIPAAARPGVIGGKTGRLLLATGYAFRTGDGSRGPFWANHTWFFWNEGGMPMPQAFTSSASRRRNGFLARSSRVCEPPTASGETPRKNACSTSRPASRHDGRDFCPPCSCQVAPPAKTPARISHQAASNGCYREEPLSPAVLQRRAAVFQRFKIWLLGQARDRVMATGACSRP